jgi:hypothetical protein
VAFAVVSIDAGIRCLRRKSSVARACVPSTRSNGEGRARSADCAPVCSCSPELDAHGEVSAGLDDAGDDLESVLLDRGALLAWREGAVRGDKVEIAGSVCLFTLPRGDSCGLVGVPPRPVSLPSRVLVCSMLEFVLEVVVEIDDSSLCSAGS